MVASKVNAVMFALFVVNCIPFVKSKGPYAVALAYFV